MGSKRFPPLAVIGFLLPNFLGFASFVLLPVLLSFYMAFTNWSLKPAVEFEYLGLQNFYDLLGLYARDRGNPATLAMYVGSVLCLPVGLILGLWGIAGNWRGMRLSGILFLLTGVIAVGLGLNHNGPGSVYLGVLGMLAGWAVLRREEPLGRPGMGWLPGMLLLLGTLGSTFYAEPMWQAYEPRDARFWQYLYNTIYLMAGLPFGILGSLGVALLLNTKLPTGSGRQRLMLTGMMVACGLLSALVVGGVGGRDAALMAGLFWGIALLGVWCNVVSFRTLFYLPTFSAGVALMILWKALYNPTHGPINQVLQTLFELFGLGLGTPDWLASVDWAKPALIIMGLWTGIGGTNMLLYLAALTNVPEALREAAEVDGAGRWATFRHVVWPQLLPTTFFISIMSVIGGLQGGFEQAKIMTGGGPAGSTTTLSYYIYNKAFQDLDLGYAASISWVLFATIFLATAMNWKFGKGGEIDI